MFSEGIGHGPKSLGSFMGEFSDSKNIRKGVLGEPIGSVVDVHGIKKCAVVFCSSVNQCLTGKGRTLNNNYIKE